MKTMVLLAVTLMTAMAVASAMSGCNRSSSGTVLSAAPESVTVNEGIVEAPMTHGVPPDAYVTLNGKPAKPEDLKPGDSVTLTTRPEGDKSVAVAIKAERPAEGKEGSSERAPPSPRNGSGEGAPRIPALPPIGNAPAPPIERAPGPPAENIPSLAERKPVQSLYLGEITFVGGQILRIGVYPAQTNPGVEMTFTLTEETQVWIGGEPGQIVDLKKGMPVSVIAERRGDQVIVRRIEVKPMPV